MSSFWLKLVITCAICFPSGLLISEQPDAFESLLASAQQAQARSEFDSAAEFYRQAVKLHPEVPEIRTNLGLMYYQTGKDDRAADEFRAAIRLKPSLFVPNLFLGLADLRLKRYEEAIPRLKQAASSKPSETQAQLGLGAAYRATGQPRLAIAAYLEAVKLDAADAEARYHLGVAYLEQVEADARILLTHHKDSGFLEALMADNFADQHAWIQADEAYKKAMGSATFPAGTHAGYGFVLINRHDLAGAEREFNAEMAVMSGTVVAKLGLARLHLEQGRTAKAADELQEIFVMNAAFLQVSAQRFNIGLAPEKSVELQRTLAARQQSGAASSEIARILRGEAADARTWSASSSGALAPDSSPGKPGQCTDSLSRLVRQLPASNLRLLASCAYQSGQYQLAFDAATKLATNTATEAEGLYWETKSAQRLATQTLAQASQMDSTSPKLHVLLGDVYRQQKSFPDAEREYRKALAIQPNDTGGLFGLSLTLLAAQQTEEALTVAETALAKHPDDPELNAVMGEILCARNDFSGAESYLKRSLGTKPEYIPHVHALLGKVYSRTGRTEQAIAELKLALTDDKDGTVHYQIARLYLQVGDRDAAKQAFDVSAQLRRQGLSRAAVAMQQDDTDTESQ